ncbi:hypothetical protein B0I35DRAFT_478646 [Stachybotrys elegans]|uniref:TMEM205-like domain-containing protein n=1 Tax=Stachybotrys elegans TaxID=80388 RepID=A0A8K0SPF0_9HYPO|nr:hypothetical protein B0I35DRAFT_478646 [Stachybotrys elegans]
MAPTYTCVACTAYSFPMLAPAHLLVYSSLLGAQLYQSFLLTKIAFQALPRPAFVSLQKRLFPVYFGVQSLLIALTAVTFPLGPSALLHRRADWIPLVAAAVPAALNLIVYGPMTRRIMLQRAQPVPKPAEQEQLLGQEVAALKKRFSSAHAMSIHLNLITMGATLWYGWRLASALSFEG